MSGYVEVISYRKEVEGNILKNLQESLAKIGVLVQDAAKQNANNPKGSHKHPIVRTAFLKDFITHNVNQGSVDIGSNVKYARDIELGAKNGSHPPYPYLFPAVEANRQAIIEIFKRGAGAESTTSSATPTKMTWRAFTSGKMSEYMKSEGGHGGAMRRLSTEWKSYKAK